MIICQIYLTRHSRYDIICVSNIFDNERRCAELNEKMKQARLARELSQAELAKMIGVSRQTINMIENGDYNPTISLCIRICKALNRTLDELFWRE